MYEIYFDFLNWTPTSPITLTGAENVLTLRSTAGDETKLTYIIGTEALIAIQVSENLEVSINDLIAQHDNDIRVTVYKDKDYTKAIFQGFIVVEDNNQPFLDPPFVLQVRALDGLGLLKGVDLVDLNTQPFVGSLSIIQWIAQILYKTDQTLNIRTYFNIFNGSYLESISPLVETQLNAIAFLKAENPPTTDPSVDINALNQDDCYTALEKICRNFRCRLFQEDGVWNLVSLYEYLNPQGYSYFEFQLLTPVSGLVPVSQVATGNNFSYDVPLGKNEIIHPVQNDGLQFLKIATKWEKLTFTYNQAQNKICNQDLQNVTQAQRNTSYDQVISSAIIDPSIQPVVNLNTIGYEAYCWTHNDAVNTTGGLDASVSPPLTPLNRGYIRVVNDALGYEIERFLVIESRSGYTSFFKASQFLLDVNDVLQISVSFRTKSGISGSGLFGFPYAIVLLQGTDGSYWALSCAEGPGLSNPAANQATWVSVNSSWQNAFGNTPICQWALLPSDSTFNWQSATAGSLVTGGSLAKVPVSGTVYFHLLCALPSGNETWYKTLNVNILSFLNGSYQQLKGDYNYVASNNNIKQTDDENVEISDSPKRYFKGALLQIDGKSLSTTSWHRKGISESLRFTQAMAYIMYNHLYRIVKKVEGTFRGLTYRDNQDFSVTRQAGYINSYYFSDSDEPTKKYMLTSFEKNYATGEGRHVFVETLKDETDTGFVTPDNYTFNYIFQ